MIPRAGLWNQTALVLSYLTGLPLQFMRSMAGFGLEAGKFYLARAKLEPPSSLAKQIFPWVEQWEQRVLLFKQKKSWDEGGLDQRIRPWRAF